MLFAFASGMTVKKRSEKKSTMLFMAYTFLLAYFLLVMNNGVVSMVMAFPAMIGFMLYMNSVLLAIGCISVYIMGSVKSFMVWSRGDEMKWHFSRAL